MQDDEDEQDQDSESCQLDELTGRHGFTSGVVGFGAAGFDAKCP